MAGKYFYKGVLINNLLQPGTITATGSSSYSDFPKAFYPVGANGTRLYSNIASPGGFTQCYKYNSNTDIGINPDSGYLSPINEFSARYTDYFYTDGSQITIIPPFTPCNHISVACVGGGGGQGGGGGIGQGAFIREGGYGGRGGDGGYAIAEKIPLKGQPIYLTVGAGGAGGDGGSKASPNFYNDGSPGSPGTPGTPTVLNVGNINILTGTGGDNGQGGGGGNISNDGGNGAYGIFTDGYINPNYDYDGSANYTTSSLTNYRAYDVMENNIADLLYPRAPYIKSYGYGGRYGGRGGYDHLNGARGGDPGKNGWCRIYFLLI